MKRSGRAEIARETLEVVEHGWYDADDGQRVEIGEFVERCVAATVLMTPAALDNLVGTVEPRAHATRFSIRNETTLEAARRLVVDDDLANTLCLNFASAKNPGGGFLGGSQAQEESLARSSALYSSLQAQREYYDINRACGTTLYTDHMILSPEVPVFRDDGGRLLQKPYLVGMLTAPAVNAGAVRRNEPHNVELIRPTMARRISQVLAVAANADYEHLILGAWGCGVFRNDPAEVAELLAEALLADGLFAGRFQSVTFAVLDNTSDNRMIGPFQRWFPDPVT